MINVTRSSMPPMDEYINEIEDIWNTHWLTNMGVKHNELQSKLKDYLDADNLILTVNGHMALEIAIQALGLTGEVITTPFTFVSTTNAIYRNGLTPVFCDINDRDYTIDVSKIESLITDKTSAIIPVHVYGNMCDIENIDKIAKKYNLKVIYDAAHTFGVTYKGKGLGAYGDATCYSFHATKVFHTIEGGAICFKNKELGDKVNLIKNFGIVDEENITMPGTNAKMNEFAAAMGLCNLRHIDEELDKRRKVEQRYRDRLDDILGIKIKVKQDDVISNASYFPIVIDSDVFGKNRDEIHELLKTQGIMSRKYFYPLTNSLDCYDKKYNVMDTPVAKYVSDNVLTLPLYADLSMDDVDRICDILLSK